MVAPGLIMELLFIFTCFAVIGIADITVVEGQIGIAKDGTTLTTTIGVALNGRNTLQVAVALRQ